jgi:hypothetical protein
MLEAQVNAGEGLEPYIVWYNGKKRIYEGSIAEGAGRFLWKAPDKNGFHTLRAEAFPFKPAPDLKGTIRELSLPVSARNKHTGAFAKKTDQFANWYQFTGDLRDTKAAGETNNAVPGQKKRPIRWLPVGGIYGLAVGPGSSYQLPLALSENRGQFLLRFKPVAEGTVFSSLFTMETASPAALELDLSAGENGLILGLKLGEEVISIPLSPEVLEKEDFITVGIDFTIDADRFTAALSLENSDSAAPASVSIPLSSGLSGKGTFLLGGSGVSVNDESAVTAILDEFAAMFLAAPPVKDETPEELAAEPAKQAEFVEKPAENPGESA